MNILGVIFKLSTPDNKIYIGRTVNLENRIKQFRYNKGLGNSNIPLVKSLKEFGFDKHNIEVLEECSSMKLLRERHKFWIKETKANNKVYTEVYNLNCKDGGTGSGPASEERKKNISKANLGMKRTAEQRKLMSDVGRSRRKAISEECEKAICDDYKNQNMWVVQIRKKYNISTEFIHEILKKYKIKIKEKGEWDNGKSSSIQVINTVTNVVYDSILEAAQKEGYTIRNLQRFLSGERENKTNLMRLYGKKFFKKYNIRKTEKYKTIEEASREKEVDISKTFKFFESQFRRGKVNYEFNEYLKINFDIKNF